METTTKERVLELSLLVAVVDTIYLSWRFVALQAGWVEPGTGLCSWTSGIDCDVVLSTPEARSFYVPNAILGLGFFSGAALWWFGGTHVLGAHARPWLVRALCIWMAIATGFTFWFFSLLVRLPALCPFCPWNHLWTWIAFGALASLWREGEHPLAPPAPLRGALTRLAAVSIGWCVLCLVAWIVVTSADLLGDGGPPPLF